MSMKDYSAELLKMEGVQIEKLDETEKEIILQISMERKMHICKRCGGKTGRIHDYRVREVRDLELRGKPVRLLYRRRRYVCPACGKRFSEDNGFVGRYMRFTHRTAEKIMQLLRRRSSMKDIAKDTGTSVSGVKRILGIMPVSKPQRLPQALSFDEFKGDTGGQPFQCIVADPLNRRVFDILPDRTAATIQEYLRPFPNRDEVKYVVMDMNRGFRNIARTFLPNAQIIIDRFHVVRCCTEAMENVRRSFQASLPKTQRRYFKRSRRLLLAHRDPLSDEDRAAVDVMLRFSDRLVQAYALKEAFYDTNYAESDLSAWKAYLAAQASSGTPVTIVYELAAPETEALTAVAPIEPQAGDVNLFTDADALTATIYGSGWDTISDQTGLLATIAQLTARVYVISKSIISSPKISVMTLAASLQDAAKKSLAMRKVAKQLVLCLKPRYLISVGLM